MKLRSHLAGRREAAGERAWRRLPGRAGGVLLAGALAAGGLAACGTSAAGSGPVTLFFYNAPDVSGATAQDAKACTAQSHGKYVVSYQQLPLASDGQRQQMARRLAARDSSLDILGLDVTWAPEFAEAGWILPWTGPNLQAATHDTLAPMLDTATWRGKLYAVPDNANTQLLWYRSDLVKTPPKTWAQMISDSEALARQHKPHLIEIQGAQYEGVTVWFNTMLASAGGSVLTPDSKNVSLGKPAITGLSIMKRLATSVGADPSLDVQMENDNRLAMESGTAAFELNYPFVYPSMKADQPQLFKHFKWAPYPQTVAGKPARVTIGGTNLAISRYSRHPQLAYQAALCLRNTESQLRNAIVGGLPPTLVSLYSNPKLFAAYPFHADILHGLQTASIRPRTPLYQILSITISHLVSPPGGIDPVSTERQMVSQLNQGLQGKGLIP
ncbi:MAG TPA: ABC transporter substrate-binding protein [Streptosporangiaceae bacterium]|jgi:multiple sugar transport system substrate-binding protein